MMLPATASTLGAPNPNDVAYLRSKLDDVQRYSMHLTEKYGSGLPTGPMTPVTRGIVQSMANFAAGSSLAADRSMRAVRLFEERGTIIPTALRQAMTGVMVLGDRLNRDAGYLQGLVGSRFVPVLGASMLTRIQRDAATALARAADALAAIDMAGWGAL